jgi:hypothetical protein
LPTSRGLSQAPTSFFGSWCQGIHRVPLLTWQLQMMLASTVQFSRYGRSRRAHPRVSGGAHRSEGRKAPVPSGPNSVPGQAAPPPPFQPRNRGRTNWLERRADRITSAPQMSCHPGTPVRDMALDADPQGPRQLLLRKEVIQPHLPVRLPCYDFVPIADPTFDGSLPYGLGHRLRVLPTFVT